MKKILIKPFKTFKPFKYIALSVIALFLLIASFNAKAQQQIYFNANISSYHFNRDAVQKYNFAEVNPGVGFEVLKVNSGYAVGVYQNSIRNNSFYAPFEHTPIKINQNLRLGYVAGAVSGYQHVIDPMVGALAKINYGKFGVNLLVVPEVQSLNVYGFIGLQLNYKIK